MGEYEPEGDCAGGWESKIMNQYMCAILFLAAAVISEYIYIIFKIKEMRGGDAGQS